MNKDFIKLAVNLSKKSSEQGKFPAGALIVKGNKILGEETSSAYPHPHLHAETKLIDRTMKKVNSKLEDYEIYTSLVHCLMCLGKIYWSGIGKVYFVLSRDDVDISMSYEGDHDFEEIVSKLNREIEFIQDKEYIEEALKIYKSWALGNK